MSILTINDDDRLSVNVTGTDVSCFGFGDGQAIADISGGQIPYINSWSDQLNQQNDTASGLQPGLYVDTISDQLGCIILDSVLIEYLSFFDQSKYILLHLVCLYYLLFQNHQ